jgi:hypothetical protein
LAPTTAGLFILNIASVNGRPNFNNLQYNSTTGEIAHL